MRHRLSLNKSTVDFVILALVFIILFANAPGMASAQINANSSASNTSGSSLNQKGQLHPTAFYNTDNSAEKASSLFRNGTFHHPPAMPLPKRSAFQARPMQLQGTPTYDEQLLAIYPQSFTSMAFNVVAAQQTGVGDIGPAYLLNAYSNQNYWYQVGVTYNWAGTGDSGFMMAYEVFDPSGQSIFPIDGGAESLPSPAQSIPETKCC